MEVVVATYLPIFVGLIVQVFVYGIGVSQGVYYFRNNRDGWKLYTFVSILLVLNAATLSLNAHSLYSMLILNFGKFDPLALFEGPGPANSPVVGAAVALVQIFFARQAYIFTSRKKVIPLIAVFLSLATFVCSIFETIAEFDFVSVSSFSSKKSKVIITLATVFPTLSDILSVSTMCWQLRSHEEFMKNRSVVRFLLFCTFNRGLLVVPIQLAFTLFATVGTNSYMWAPVEYALPGVYMCSCLAMINFRDTIRAKLIPQYSIPHITTQGNKGMDFAAPPATQTNEQTTTTSFSSGSPLSNCSGGRSMSSPVSEISTASSSTMPVVEIIVVKDF